MKISCVLVSWIGSPMWFSVLATPIKSTNSRILTKTLISLVWDAAWVLRFLKTSQMIIYVHACLRTTTLKKSEFLERSLGSWRIAVSTFANSNLEHYFCCCQKKARKLCKLSEIGQHVERTQLKETSKIDAIWVRGLRTEFWGTNTWRSREVRGNKQKFMR